MKPTAIILFILTYILLLVFPKKRAYIALTSASLYVIAGIMPVHLVLNTVNWNVILMIIGTMGIVSMFIESKMPELLADMIIEKTPNIKWTIISLALFSGIISAFIDNVATVLMIAPIALTLAKKLDISPVPGVIAIAISSNLQGAATLVGDTTSILLGGYAGLNFIDFFFLKGKIGLFWIVQAGALASILVLMFIFRKDNQPVSMTERVIVKDFVPTVLLIGMIMLLILASFLPNMPGIINGLICIGLFLTGSIFKFLKTRDFSGLLKTVKEIDYFTILLLAGLFIVIGSISKAGVVEDISRLFIEISNDNIFVIYSLIVWASVLFSAFIDNIPYVATMLPVVAGIANALNIDPYLLYFGLITGATLGGNLTPIGALANITGLGVLHKEGHSTSTGQFMRMSIPFTLAAVSIGYILVWLIWR